MSSTAPGHREDAEDAPEDRLPAGEAQPGQRVPGQAVQEHPAERDERGATMMLLVSHRPNGMPAFSVKPKIRFHADSVAGSGISDSELLAASASVLNEVASWMRNGPMNTQRPESRISAAVAEAAPPRAARWVQRTEPSQS